MSAFLPTAVLLLAIVGAQQTAVSVGDFRTADQITKVKVLSDIATARANVAIDQVIALARAGLHDSSAEVRMSALGAVMGRTMAARWAGTSGPGMGPTPVPRPEQRVIPAQWKGDQDVLRDALEDDCLALVKSDPDDRVRYQAFLAVGNLERPMQPEGPLSERIVAVFVDLYRRDSSSRIRAEIVKTFRLVPNNVPEMRAVLRDALVDANASIRHEGLTAITPQATPGLRRLSFDEARDVVVAALRHADPGVRLGGVQALNVFGLPAAPYIPALERLSEVDPDAQVRASARLAIEAIQRALRGSAEAWNVCATLFQRAA